jgi:catechol 2,3-dioxygenase-like lactoylglutathione lyase family enzyme
MKIAELRLQTDCLPAVKEFYTRRLGMQLAWESAEAFALQCGHSRLVFEAGQAAYYHFAFNIPSEAVAAAADWLVALGIDLLPFEGNAIVPFPNWVAEAVYFHDPAGNIVEFIARKRLQIPFPAGGFKISQIAGVSEIGFPTVDPAGLRAALQAQIGLAAFWCPAPTFCALGDENGLVIVVDALEKRWIPTMAEAIPFPFSATLHSPAEEWNLAWDGTKLAIHPSMDSGLGDQPRQG